jgi:GxxExxY protein
MRETADCFSVYCVRLNELSGRIIGAAMKVHTALGAGLLERTYQLCLAHELTRSGLSILVEAPVPVYYEDLTVEHGYRIDIVVENTVAVEVKTVSALLDVHRSQVLTQLRFSGLPLGLLINFHEEHLKNGIARIIRPPR